MFSCLAAMAAAVVVALTVVVVVELGSLAELVAAAAVVEFLDGGAVSGKAIVSLRCIHE